MRPKLQDIEINPRKIRSLFRTAHHMKQLFNTQAGCPKVTLRFCLKMIFANTAALEALKK